MNAIQRVILLWGFLSTGVLSAVISPTTCRPPLPIDWFISQAQTLPEFSVTLTTAFNTASGSLYKLIDNIFTNELNVDAISTVVAGPWGIVAEHYVGPLRSNDTTDHRIVQGDSSYRIASLSKVLTVLELLILHERGKLSFDDSALKYFPTLNLSPDITLEMLASQMSGIGRDRTNDPIPPDLDLTNYVAGTCGYSYFGCSEQQFLDYIGRFPPVFQPETQASYSNDAYSLLGLIIKIADGRGLTYEEIIQKDIFDPLQMTHSFFVPSITQEEFIVVANDTPSDTTGIDKNLYLWNPAGGAYSSAYDWTNMLHRLFLSKPTLLSLVTTKKWLRALFTNPDFVTEVGMPWEINVQTLSSGRHTKIFGKDGSVTKYKTYMTIDRTLGFSAVSFNAGNNAVGPEIAIAANEIFAPVFENAILELWNNKWGGKYVLNDALVEILVDFSTGSIQLARLESEGVDWIVQATGLTGPRNEILAYLWPGIDDVTYRVTAGNSTLPGAACSNVWFSFDNPFIGNWPRDMLQFVEEDGKVGITYPAVNLTAWKV